MNVLLVQPFVIAPSAWVPYLPQEPLGLEYLAGYLNRYSPDTKVKIMDCIANDWQSYVKVADKFWVGSSPSQILQQAKELKPDIIGIPMQFCNQEFEVDFLSTILKRSCHETKIIVGGCAASAEPIELLHKMKYVDAIVIGEGEITLKEIAEGKEFSSINGIAYRQDGTIIKNRARSYIENLDSIPIPIRKNFDVYSLSFATSSLADRFRIAKLWYKHNRDWSTVRETLLSSRAKSKPNVASLVASRGCPFNCYFCSTQNAWNRKYRQRSVSNVMTEMKYLYNECGVRTFHFMDDNFNISQKWVKEFCETIIDWDKKIELRMQDGFFPSINKETLSLLKMAGLKDIFFGIESGNQRVLKEVIGKPVSLGEVKEIIDECHEVGINVGGYFLVGMPGETLKEMEETVAFTLNSGLDRVRLYTCQPLPGSRLYNDCLKNSWLAKDYDPAKALLIGSDSYITTPEFNPVQIKELIEAARTKLRNSGKLYQRKK